MRNSMKIERYYYILLIFLICILSISAVSAADDTTSNTINTNIDDTIIDSADEEIIDESSEETKLIESSENFISLDSKINGNQDEIVILEKDYAYDDSTDESYKEGIKITRKVTIDGQNHTISGSNQAKIFNISSSDVTIMNINFIKGNSTKMGGAILWNGDNGKLTGCNFTQNQECSDYSDYGGGAIYWNGDNGKLTGCNFTQNQAGSCGGAIYWNGDNGIVNNNTFTNNSAFTEGGAIWWGGIYLKEYLANNGTINNNIFIQNQAKRGSGGAIDFISHNGTINNNIFIQNQAKTGYGGAIGFPGNNVTINNNNFTSNTAHEGGAICGGADSEKCHNGTINNNTFTNNTAHDGGAIYWYYGNQTTINNNTFTNNTAKGGGAIYWRAGDQATLNNNTFTNNTANGMGLDVEQSDGGAIYWRSGDQATINNNTFTQNQAKLDSGFVFHCEHYEKLNIKINNNIFLNNTGSGEIFIRIPDESNADYNWFGNTADNYTDTPRIHASFTTWLFLNATADPNTIEVFNSSEISFKLSVYNASNREVSEYDNTLMPTAKMTTSATKGTVNNYAILGNSVEYIASELGTASVTAKIENIEYTINLINTIANPHLSVPSEEINYGENLIHLSYNEKATGTVNITLKGKNGNNYKFENLELKNAIKLPKNILPDEYNIIVEYSGDTNFYDANANGKLIVKKATPKLTAKAKAFKLKNKTKKYKVTLKDNKGNALKNKKVTLKVNGKTYTAKTNSKGVATFKLSKLTKKGTFTAVVTYEGNKYYKKVTKKPKITVKAPAKKSTWKTVSKGSKDKATVKKIQRALKNNGYYLSYKGRYLKVDGIYHSCTVRSVKQFQKAKNLKVTGKVDEKTAKKLKIY